MKKEATGRDEECAWCAQAVRRQREMALERHRARRRVAIGTGFLLALALLSRWLLYS